MGRMVNGKRGCEGKGLGIQRDRKGRRKWKGRSEIREGGESSECLPISHQTLHPNFDGVWEGMSSFGQGGEELKSEAEEGLKAEAEGKRREP